jgi:hypothetical protein
MRCATRKILAFQAFPAFELERSNFCKHPGNNDFSGKLNHPAREMKKEYSASEFAAISTIGRGL